MFTQYLFTFSLSGIKLRLPDSYQGQCKSNKELFPRIVPIQCELLATELELRLDPFLPHQYMRVDREEAHKAAKARFLHLMAASSLAEAVRGNTDRYPADVTELADWLEKMMRTGLEQGIERPTLKISGPFCADDRMHTELLDIHLATAIVLMDRLADHKDPKLNPNLFSIVMTPHYPKGFGRYSEQVLIGISREADFDNLSPQTRRRIRRQSNTVLKKGGVRIKNLEEDKQESGLWLPRYR